MGAAGRDFHNFNTFYRDNEQYKVAAFTSGLLNCCSTVAASLKDFAYIWSKMAAVLEDFVCLLLPIISLLKDFIYLCSQRAALLKDFMCFC